MAVQPTASVLSLVGNVYPTQVNLTWTTPASAATDNSLLVTANGMTTTKDLTGVFTSYSLKKLIPATAYSVVESNIIANVGAIGSNTVSFTTPASIPDSVSGSSITTPGSFLYLNNITYGLNSSGQITINGIVDSTSNNVIQLSLVNGVLYQLNNSNNWYTEPLNGGPGVISNPPVLAGTTGPGSLSIAVNGSLALSASGSFIIQ